MIKLSSLPMNTTLVIHDFAFRTWIIMKKEDLMDSCYLLDRPYPEIFIAHKDVPKTNLIDILVAYSKDAHLPECWAQDVYNGISCWPETRQFMKRLRKAVRNNAIYTAGEEVEIDLTAA